MYLWKVSLAWLILALLMAAPAFAHGGARVVFVPDGFGGARAVVVGGYYGGYQARGFNNFNNSRNFGNVSPFNQNGGVNRIGRRR